MDEHEVRQFTQYEVARLFRVPDYFVGLPSPWWRRLLQRYVTRRPNR